MHFMNISGKEQLKSHLLKSHLGKILESTILDSKEN